jgi:hypothetical protein
LPRTRPHRPSSLLHLGARRFITTCWETIAPSSRSARERDEALRVQSGSMAAVYRLYGAAVHSYIEVQQARYGIPRRLSAADLTQEFFEVQLRRGALTQLDPGKGSFRAWLKQCLRHFLLDVRERECAAIRNQGREPAPLLQADGRETPIASEALPADEQTDRREAMRCVEQVCPDWQTRFDTTAQAVCAQELTRRRQERKRALESLAAQVRPLMYKRRDP